MEILTSEIQLFVASKIEGLVKYRTFGKNRNLGRKQNFRSKLSVELSVKTFGRTFGENRTFGTKSNFWSKMEIVQKLEILINP